MPTSSSPTIALTRHGLLRLDADMFLKTLHDDHPDAMRAVAETVRTRAESLSGEAWDMRKLMKKARLYRFARALAA
jgi:hypothetical protein